MLIKHSNTSNILRFTLKNSSTGIGLTGLTNASAGMIIAIICNNEATTTVYTQAASNIETIAALGTYAAPTANKCRFKEVDATNHKGLYEFQFANARFAIASARSMAISVTGAASLLDADYEIQLVSFDPHDSVRMGLTAMPNAAADGAGGLPISDAGGLDLDTKLANAHEITAARMGALTDWINGGRLDLLLDAIPTTAMRGTDNAALASVLGALNDAASDGDPTAADTLMKYIKQLINILVGTAGIVAFPAEAGPANAISLAEVIRAIHADVTGLNGSAMVGTNGANTTVPDAAGVAATPAEVATALTNINLDHLCKTATAGADMTAEVVDNTILSRILSNGDTSVFVPSTDGLQLIRDRGDSAWTTGAGGSDRLLMVDTTIATLASQTSFTLTAGSTDDDAYNNCTVVIEDVSTATQKAVGVISDYIGGTKTVTLKYDPAIFTMATTDKVYILAENALKSTLANRQLNVAADGDIAGNVDGSVASVAGHTAQTGDSYAVVTHADHGNAKLVRSTTPANKLDISATGEAGLDFNNIKDATGAKTLTNITVPTCSTNTDMRGTDGANTTVPDVAGTAATLHATTDGKIDTNKTELDGLQGTDGKALVSTDAQDLSGTLDVNTKTATATALDLILKDSTFALAIADAIWDEILTGATHNIASSAGRKVREIGAFAIHSGTAQAGSGHSITLDAGASASDGVYNRNLIVLTDNTGAGQTRTIVDYNGTTKVCVIDRDWRISPDATTAYQIVPDDTPLTVDHGVAQGGTSTTITIRGYASSIDDTYLCNIVTIIAGKGRGQARLVGAYNGTTKVVTICGDNWVETPDATSIYVMMPYGTTCTSCIGTNALGQINAEVVDVIKTDTKGEPAQGAPGATLSIEDKIAFIYKFLRNQVWTTETEINVYNNAADTVDHKSTISDDGTTFKRGEFESGP